MNRMRLPVVIGVILTAFSPSLFSGCASAKRGGQEHPSVASASPQPGRPIEVQPQQPEAELFYGEGDCGPRFPNGMRGTCINNKPCSGFGVRDAGGQMECDCFGVRGGCGEGLVCSVRRRACVEPRKDEK